MKVKFEAKSEAGSDRVEVVLSITGRAPSFKLEHLDDQVRIFLWCSTKSYNGYCNEAEKWRFTINRQHGGVQEKLSQYADLIVAANKKLFADYPAMKLIIEKEG